MFYNWNNTDLYKGKAFLAGRWLYTQTHMLCDVKLELDRLRKHDTETRGFFNNQNQNKKLLKKPTRTSKTDTDPALLQTTFTGNIM